MTREDVINELRKLEYYGRPFDNSKEQGEKAIRKAQALAMAIQILEQEPCEDDFVNIKAFTDTTICEGISCNECSFNTLSDGQTGCGLVERVENLPRVQPKLTKCENCCNGNQEEKAKLCQKSYLAGMEHMQEPCDDCISRQAALDTFGLSEKSRKYGGDHSGYDTIMLYEVQDALEALPSVQPKPKTGHWIRWYEQKENDGYIEHIPHCKCSECGKEYDPHSSQFVKYCNECGTKMEVSV